MASGNIPDSAFEIVQYVFSGRCRPGAGGVEDVNEKPYMWFDYTNSTYLKVDEENLPDEVINTPAALREYIWNHRNMQDTLEGANYPVYVIGATTDEGGFNAFGATYQLVDTVNFEIKSYGLIIFVEKIKDSFPGSGSEEDDVIGIILSHELGHYIGRVTHDDPHVRNCLMIPTDLNTYLICERHRFCTFDIYMVRGNFYRYGNPEF